MSSISFGLGLVEDEAILRSGIAEALTSRGLDVARAVRREHSDGGVLLLTSFEDPRIRRAAFDPVIAGAGVALDASGSGTYSFSVPAAAGGSG